MTINLREQAADRLRDEAREERRSVRDHAADLLERQLLEDDRRDVKRAEPPR